MRKLDGATLILAGIAILFVVTIVAVVVGSDEKLQTSVQTDDSSPVPDTDLPPEAENTVNGLVEEVFEDCARHRVFENGQIVERDTISCDGGSYIVINGLRIGTVSGFVQEGFAYFYDIGELKPGDQATATYAEDSFGNKNLDCDQCGIETH